MGWDVVEFYLASNEGAARVFNYELELQNEEPEETRHVFGDGVVMGSGQVYFNRPERLKEAVKAAGANPEGFIDTFADWVVNQFPR
jgi:hypothetical protein